MEFLMCEPASKSEITTGAGAQRNSPHWKRQMERAMRELDPENLTRQVHAAEEAIFLRWQEMEKNPSLRETRELEEIKAATNELLTIKTQKLNWPDPFRTTDPNS